VDTSADVKIGIIAAAEDPLGLGTFSCDPILKEGGIAGTTIATHAFVRDIDNPGVFSGDTTTLSAGEKAAVSDWTDLCLVIGTPDAGLAIGAFYVSEVWLEYTEGSGGGSSRRRNLPLMGVG